MQMPVAKKERKTKKAQKEAEHKSLWENYNERQINTNARVKWKMAALSSKQTIETKWPDGKDGENDKERSRRKRDGKKSITPTWSKTVHGN